jgi:hypothetical protein
MANMGVLEMLARADLDALVEELDRRYEPGALDRLSAGDPGWRAELERREAEVGGLYAALRDADRTFGEWRRAVTELRQLWARVEGHRPAVEAGVLDQVA